MKTITDLIRRLATGPGEEASWEDLVGFLKAHKSFSVSAGSLMHAKDLKPKKTGDSGFELFNSEHNTMVKVLKSDAAQIKAHGKGYYFNHAGTIYHLEAE